MADDVDEGACDMRGMLSFMILWLLSKRPMYGQELATEIGKRRGERPNPGTIYPALKDLAGRGMIEAHLEGHNNVYELTDRGREGLLTALEYFRKAFGEISVGFGNTQRPREATRQTGFSRGSEEIR